MGCNRLGLAAVLSDMTSLTEHERCALARAYRAAITLDDRRALAQRAGITLTELSRVAR
jgi:hypothetical protein